MLHIPDDSLCLANQKCVAGRGCVTCYLGQEQCSCNDNIACTFDVLLSTGCTFIPQDSKCSEGQACNTQLGCQNQQIAVPPPGETP